MNIFLTTIILAYRNLFRNRARTISTLLAIVAGLLGLTLLDGFVTYSMNNFRDAIIHSGTGHLEIFSSQRARDESDSNPIPFLFKNPRGMENQLRSFSEVADVMPVLSFSAVVTDGDKNDSVQVSAYPLQQAKKELSLSRIVKGTDLAPGETGRILLGTSLAQRLKLKVGSTVQLFAQIQGGGINTESLTVAGLTCTGIKDVDDRAVEMSLADAQSLLQVKSVAKLVVFLHQTRNTKDVLRRLTTLPPGTPLSGKKVESWDKLSVGFQYANAMYQLILAVARFVVLIVVLFSISGTLTLSIIERYREMGTLRAFGTRKSSLTLLLAFEGLFLGALGGLLGALAALGVTACLNLFGGITFSAEPGMSVQTVKIFFTPRITTLLQNCTILLLTALVAGLFPAATARRRTVAELLRSTSN